MLLAEDFSTLLYKLLVSVLWCPARPTGADRGLQVTHQPSVDISALCQWPPLVLTTPVSHLIHTITWTKIQVKCSMFTAWIWPSLIESGCACLSSHTLTRVCPPGKFNPSFILHWVHISFHTELSSWTKVSMHCYNLDKTHRCNPAWV